MTSVTTATLKSLESLKTSDHVSHTSLRGLSAHKKQQKHKADALRRTTNADHNTSYQVDDTSLCKDSPSCFAPKQLDTMEAKAIVQSNKLELRETLEYRDSDIQLNLARDIHPDMTVEKYKRLLQDSDRSLESATSNCHTVEQAQAQCRRLKRKLRQRCNQVRELQAEFRLLCKSIEKSQLEHFKLEALLRKFIADEENKIAQLNLETQQKDKELEIERRRTQDMVLRFREISHRNAKLKQIIQENSRRFHSTKTNYPSSSSSSVSPLISASANLDSTGSSSWDPINDSHKASFRTSPKLPSTVLSSRFHDTLRALPPQTAAEIVAEISHVLERLLVDETSASSDKQQLRTPAVFYEKPKLPCDSFEVLNNNSDPNRRCSDRVLQQAEYTDLSHVPHSLKRTDEKTYATYQRMIEKPYIYKDSYATDTELEPCNRLSRFSRKEHLFRESEAERPGSGENQSYLQSKHISEASQHTCIKQRAHHRLTKPWRHSAQTVSSNEALSYYPRTLSPGAEENLLLENDSRSVWEKPISDISLKCNRRQSLKRLTSQARTLFRPHYNDNVL